MPGERAAPEREGVWEGEIKEEDSGRCVGLCPLGVAPEPNSNNTRPALSPAYQRLLRAGERSVRGTAGAWPQAATSQRAGGQTHQTWLRASQDRLSVRDMPIPFNIRRSRSSPSTTGTSCGHLLSHTRCRVCEQQSQPCRSLLCAEEQSRRIGSLNKDGDDEPVGEGHSDFQKATALHDTCQIARGCLSPEVGGLEGRLCAASPAHGVQMSANPLSWANTLYVERGPGTTPSGPAAYAKAPE